MSFASHARLVSCASPAVTPRRHTLRNTDTSTFASASLLLLPVYYFARPRDHHRTSPRRYERALESRDDFDLPPRLLLLLLRSSSPGAASRQCVDGSSLVSSCSVPPMHIAYRVSSLESRLSPPTASACPRKFDAATISIRLMIARRRRPA